MKKNHFDPTILLRQTSYNLKSKDTFRSLVLMRYEHYYTTMQIAKYSTIGYVAVPLFAVRVLTA